MDSSLLQLLNPKCELHAGLSIDGDTYHYVLVARYKKGEPKVISMRKGMVAAMKIPFHVPLHANLGSEHALLIAEKIGEQSPEEWIDSNENRIIPQGIASDEILNEWQVHEETLFSCTITKKAYDKILSDIHSDSMTLASMSPPLWDLAGLYSRKINGPFFLWKLSTSGSILGFVENGRLCGLCNFWAGTGDMATDNGEIGKELQRLVQSLARGVQCDKMVVYSENAKTNIDKTIKIPGMNVLSALTVEKVPVDFHEAYALAMHQETNLDFTEPGCALEARELTRSRARALRVIRGAFAVAAFMVAVLIVLKGGSTIGERYVNGKTAPIMTHLKRYKTEKSRLESLSLQMKEKAQFFNRKSALTYPISEMQIAFPEGLWAEEIAFSESSQEQWNFSIIAFSSSSALIPELLKNLSLIKGMGNVRMAYSEQTAVKSKTGERAIKFRIEGVYSKKEHF